MAKIPRTTPTVQIQGPGWEAHEHVVVRTYVGAMERKAIGDAGVLVRQSDGKRGNASAQINTAEAARAKLKAGIVSWTISYEDGSPLPFSDEGIELLPDSYAQYILDELTRLWAAWDSPPLEPKPGESAEAATKRAAFRVGKNGRSGPGGEAAR